MSGAEQAPGFSLEVDFDVNAAFQAAMFGVATDEELALDQRVSRMEGILSESNSEVYRDFVDLRSMAATMEALFNHDCALHEAAQASEAISNFMNSMKDYDGHDHRASRDKRHKEDDEDVDSKTGKKKKKRSWFGVYT